MRTGHSWARRCVGSPVVVILLLLACLLLLRLPTVLLPRELNVDESQMLSNAMQYLAHPHLKAVDAGGLGPLDSMLPAAFLLLGFKPSFIFIHTLATGLVSLQVLLAYLTLRRIGSGRIAAFGALLMVLFYGLAADRDLLPYSTELVPGLLCMLGFYVFVLLLQEHRSSRRGSLLLLFIGGLMLGAAPWGKLQSLPIAGALGLLTIAAIVGPAVPSSNRFAKATEVLALGSGAVLPTCIMLAIWVKYRPITDFWNGYVLGPLAYAGHVTFRDVIRNLIIILLLAPLRQLVFVGLLVVVYAAVRGSNLVLPPWQPWVWTGLLVYLGAALFTVLRVKYPFAHHEIFIVPPLVYAIAGLAFGTSGTPQERQYPEKWVKTSLALAVGAAALLYGAYAVHYYQTFRALHLACTKRSISTGQSQRSNERVAATIRTMQRTKAIGSLAIWGWAPGVYVLTGMPAATRDSMTQYELNQGVMQPYYRARYLSDLQSSRPDLFIDAAVPSYLPQWTDWPGDVGYESDPELKQYIDQNYVLAEQLALVAGEKPVRFFLRKCDLGPTLR